MAKLRPAVPTVRAVMAAAGLALVAACAAEPEAPPAAALPVPPPAPPRAHRPAAQRPRAPETPPPASTQAEPPPAQNAAAAPAAGAWRVARDGTLGCADVSPLRLLRNAPDASPRLLAEARAAGGCRTTFRMNTWSLVETESDFVRLRLTNGGDLTLWFLRRDLVAP